MYNNNPQTWLTTQGLPHHCLGPKEPPSRLSLQSFKNLIPFWKRASLIGLFFISFVLLCVYRGVPRSCKNTRLGFYWDYTLFPIGKKSDPFFTSAISIVTPYGLHDGWECGTWAGGRSEP